MKPGRSLADVFEHDVVGRDQAEVRHGGGPLEAQVHAAAGGGRHRLLWCKEGVRMAARSTVSSLGYYYLASGDGGWQDSLVDYIGRMQLSNDLVFAFAQRQVLHDELVVGLQREVWPADVLVGRHPNVIPQPGVVAEHGGQPQGGAQGNAGGAHGRGARAQGRGGLPTERPQSAGV